MAREYPKSMIVSDLAIAIGAVGNMILDKLDELALTPPEEPVES